MRPRVILVTGSHRTGSSALTRLLALWGAVLPGRLMQANAHNPLGYWEAQDAVALNDAFFRNLGSSWYDTSYRLQDPGAVPTEVGRRFIDDIARMIVSSFDGGLVKVLKDPRITILLPYWIAGIREAGHDMAVIHTYRDAESHARSLMARDGFDVPRSVALWTKYNLLGERDSRDVPRTFVSFDEIMNDWKPTVSRLVADLDIDLALSAEAEASAAAFIKPDPNKHRTTASFKDCFSDLRSTILRAFDARLAGEERGELEQAYDRYVQAERYFREVGGEAGATGAALEEHSLTASASDPLEGRRERAETILGLRTDVERLQEQVGAFRDGCNERDGTIVDLWSQIAGLRREVGAFSDGCRERDGTIVGLWSQIAGLRREVGAFSGGCRERDGTIVGLWSRIGGLQEEVGAFRGGCRERDETIRAMGEDLARRDAKILELLTLVEQLESERANRGS